MGKAKDGSECFTRQNKAGGKYVTCEGTQKARKSASKPIPPDSARAKGRRSAAARKLTTRPAAAGRIQTGSLNPGSVITDFDTSAFVSEAPGVVGMTSTMSPLGEATFAALLNAGQDVAAGISAAVAAREKDEPLLKISKSNPNVGRYDVEFSSGTIDTERGYYVKLRDKPLTEGEFVKWIHAGESIQSENRKKMKELFNEVKSQGFKLYFVLETDQKRGEYDLFNHRGQVGNPDISFNPYINDRDSTALKVVALDKKGKIGNPNIFWNEGKYPRPLDSRDFDKTGIASHYSSGKTHLIREHFAAFFKPTDIGARIKFHSQDENIREQFLK